MWSTSSSCLPPTAGAPANRATRGSRSCCGMASSPGRLEADVPMIAELYPGFEMHIWLGVFAPAATPQAIVGKLREEVNKALELPDAA